MKAKHVMSKYSILLVFMFLFSNELLASARLKELARIEGIRDNSIIGYGLVVGLAGTGDSSRSNATTQSVANTLSNFGIEIPASDVNSRNVAAVVLTSNLPAYAQPGDKLDVSVSSLGDARSLVGGTLLQAPLKAANGDIYALAQGAVLVGGYKFDLNDNIVQKNHPTVGAIPNGAIVERGISPAILQEGRFLKILLYQPDFTTVNRVRQAVSKLTGESRVQAVNARTVRVDVNGLNTDLVSLIMKIENISIEPDRLARIVINERTGTVVAGGEVAIDNVTISHDDLKVVITTDNIVSQPLLVRQTGAGVTTAVVPDTEIEVEESVATAVNLPLGTTIADLVAALRKIKTSTRDVISILQAIKASGALHAELVIQ